MEIFADMIKTSERVESSSVYSNLEEIFFVRSEQLTTSKNRNKRDLARDLEASLHYLL